MLSTSTDIGTLIVKSPETCGGCPRVAGTRFSVQQVAVLDKQGLTAAEIVNEYNFLTLAQVYAALAYYYANQPEIETYLAEEETEYARLSTQRSAQ